MASGEAGARVDAPAVETNSEASEGSQTVKTCVICSLPANRHFGPIGRGRCWGTSQCGPNSVFASNFAELRELILSTRAELRAERSEAKDREKRLLNQLSALSRELKTSQETIVELEEKVKDLSSQLKNTTQRVGGARENRRENKKKSTKDATGEREQGSSVSASSVSASTADLTQPESTSLWDDLIEADEALESVRTHANGSAAGEDNHRASSTRGRSTTRERTQTVRPRSQSQKRPTTDKPMRSYTLPAWDSEDDDDDNAPWRLVVAKNPGPRKTDIYVGNLLPDANDENVKKFIESRAAQADHPIKIYNCSVKAKNDDEGSIFGCSARLTVRAADSELLCDRKFWPRPTYARIWKWKPKNKLPPSGTQPDHDQPRGLAASEESS